MANTKLGEKHKMFLNASQNPRRCDEILCFLMCDIGVYPKGTNIIFSLTLLCFSRTFNMKTVFVPDTGTALICFLSDKKDDNGIQRQQWWPGSVWWGAHKACISFWRRLKVVVLLLIRGERIRFMSHLYIKVLSAKSRWYYCSTLALRVCV